MECRVFDGGGQRRKTLRPRPDDLPIRAVTARLLEGLRPPDRLLDLLQHPRDRLALQHLVVEAPGQVKPFYDRGSEEATGLEGDAVARAARAVATPLTQAITHRRERGYTDVGSPPPLAQAGAEACQERVLPGIGRPLGPLQEDARRDPDGMVVFLRIVEVLKMRRPEGAALNDAEEPYV
jgi:hypothetical protein